MLIIMGVFNLSLWGQRRDDRGSLWLSILCFDLASRQFVTSGFLELLWPEPNNIIHELNYRWKNVAAVCAAAAYTATDFPRGHGSHVHLRRRKFLRRKARSAELKAPRAPPCSGGASLARFGTILPLVKNPTDSAVPSLRIVRPTSSHRPESIDTKPTSRQGKTGTLQFRNDNDEAVTIRTD